MIVIPTARLIFGGFMGTVALTLIFYAGPLLGMPPLDLAGLIGRLFTLEPVAAGSSFWWWGFFVHVFFGAIVFPVLYRALARRAGYRAPVARGTEFGFLLWLGAMLIGMPLLGAGLFASETPRALAVAATTLIAHLVYGATLGALARPTIRFHSEDVTVHRHRRRAA